MNFIIILSAALIPMLVGFIWYNPKVFGNAWMQASEMTEDKIKGANMLKIFGFTFLMSLMMALALQMLVIHQVHIASILTMHPTFKDTNSEAALMFAKFTELFGNDFRTFKHGVFHGTIAGLFLALPIVATNALFERKSFKYISINAGYWVVSMALMGGVLCAFIKL